MEPGALMGSWYAASQAARSEFLGQLALHLSDEGVLSSCLLFALYTHQPLCRFAGSRTVLARAGRLFVTEMHLLQVAWQRAAQRMDCLGALPSELYQGVLRFLGMPSLLRARCVCRKWQHLIDECSPYWTAFSDQLQPGPAVHRVDVRQHVLDVLRAQSRLQQPVDCPPLISMPGELRFFICFAVSYN